MNETDFGQDIAHMDGNSTGNAWKQPTTCTMHSCEVFYVRQMHMLGVSRARELTRHVESNAEIV